MMSVHQYDKQVFSKFFFIRTSFKITGIIMAFCEQCGGALEEGAKFCEHCGAAVGAGSPPAHSYSPPQQTWQAPAPSPAAPSGQKNPVIAAVASFFFAGLGQTYNGSILKGLGVFVAVIILSLVHSALGFVGLLASVAEAYMTAKKMNEGSIPFVPHSLMLIIVHVAVVFIIAIIVLIAAAGL
jgi:TM2 domain-containing membrane protein YozV